MDITAYQRRVLVEHALEANGAGGTPTPELAFADVIADLAMDREVRDRDQLVRFLWRRVSIAVDAGPSRRAHWVWSAAVQLLDECGEDLDDIFTGREMVIRRVGFEPTRPLRTTDFESVVSTVPPPPR
jgi:hypothetical protein